MSLIENLAYWYLGMFPGTRDDSFGLIDKLNLKSDLAKGDWNTIESKLSKLSDDDFSRVITEFCNGEQFNKEIEQFIRTPETEFQNVIAGCYYISVGYLKRSGAWASELSEDQINGMYEYLDKADDCLRAEFDNKRYDVEASARLIAVLLNTGSKEEAAYYFEKCKSLNPKSFMAHVRYFRVLVPRWGGSNEAMLAYLESIEDKPLKDMIRVMVLNELFNDLYNEDETTALQKFKNQSGSLIQEALKNTTIPNDDSIVTIHTKNYLAMLYNILEMRKERDELLSTMSNRITRYPWAYYGMHNEKDITTFNRLGLLSL